MEAERLNQELPQEQEVDPVFVERVLDKIQIEVGDQLVANPSMSLNEIKLAAMNRLIDLINKDLLTQAEADKIYQRFALMVHHYYSI